MRTVTLHRRNSDPDSSRIVEDGFRLSVFLLPPVALLSRGLWGASLLWLALVAAIVGAAAAGALSFAAALAAVVIIHAAFAIDTPDLERRRLQKRGWMPVALTGPFGTVPPSEGSAPVAGPATAPVPSTSPGHTDVIGLFPGERR